MEQGGYLNGDADISDFTEVNLSVPPILLVTDCDRHSMQYSDLSDNILSLVMSAAVKLCYHF
ncbi:MAG: hypothetical protein ACJAYC_003276 [Halieaceae bacterium]|jgi:hypothetical protein